MKLVYQNPNPSGAYPPIQEGNYSSVPEGMAVWPDTLPTDDFYAYHGCVTLVVEQVATVVGQQEAVVPPETEDGEPTTVMQDVTVMIPTVTACTPNTVAREEWRASLPEPAEAVDEPTAQDDTDAMLVDHEYRITLIELGIDDV